MVIINDIELLARLSKNRILNYLADRCHIAISGIRLGDYSLNIKRAMDEIKKLHILHVEKESFDVWIEGKRKFLTISDLSSIYLTISTPGATLILSPEDEFLIGEVKRFGVSYMQFDDFIIQTIKDEKLINLYNLIKAA